MIDWWQEGILRCSPRPDNAHFSKRKHHLCSSGDEAIEAARPAHQLALPRRPDNFCVSVLFFSTVMIASFLQESSIHGLRYLVEAKSSLVKTIWFVCIAACVTASFVIIYYNVVNWHNSPAVVTSVYPSLVKVWRSFVTDSWMNFGQNSVLRVPGLIHVIGEDHEGPTCEIKL